MTKFERNLTHDCPLELALKSRFNSMVIKGPPSRTLDSSRRVMKNKRHSILSTVARSVYRSSFVCRPPRVIVFTNPSQSLLGPLRLFSFTSSFGPSDDFLETLSGSELLMDPTNLYGRGFGVGSEGSGLRGPNLGSLDE